jgi:hypothetical protein
MRAKNGRAAKTADIVFSLLFATSRSIDGHRAGRPRQRTISCGLQRQYRARQQSTLERRNAYRLSDCRQLICDRLNNPDETRPLIYRGLRRAVRVLTDPTKRVPPWGIGSPSTTSNNFLLSAGSILMPLLSKMQRAVAFREIMCGHRRGAYQSMLSSAFTASRPVMCSKRRMSANMRRKR